VDRVAGLPALRERLHAAVARDDLLRDLEHVARLVVQTAPRDLGIDLLIVRDDAVDERSHGAMVVEERRLLLHLVLRLVVHVADAEERRLAAGLPAAPRERRDRDDTE